MKGPEDPGRRRARAALRGVVTACVIALLIGAALPAGAGARRSPPASFRTQISLAARGVGKIPRGRFARGQRAPLLSAVAAARRLSGRPRPALCPTAAAVNTAVSRLGLPSTWRRHRAPGSARGPLRLLNRAEMTLLRRAGRRCAVPQRVTVRIAPQRGGSGFTPLPPPPQGPEQGEGAPIPLGPFHPPQSIGGPAGPGADLHAIAPALRRHGAPSARLAADPLAFFRSADVGVPPRTASPQEPTTAEGGNVVWFTGNTSDALSTDAGRTFTTLNPSTILPDSGLPFCCDQVVSYSPQANLFVWVMQYWCGPGSTSPATNDCRTAGTSSNRIRIAVASPQALIADAASPGAAWTYWDLTPQTFGQPAGAWFDRSDLGVNIWNMNWTVDVLRGASGVASILARVDLSDLARRGSITISYITDGNQRMTVAQGLGTTTSYYVGTNSLSQQRIWSYAAFAGSMFRHDVNHTSVPNLNSAATGTDNSDWYDRYGIFPGAIESATISGNTLFTAQGTGRSYCTANCGTPTATLVSQFAQPSIFVSRYDVNRWTDAGERWIWNPTLAFTWPALQTDGAGDVGLTFRSAAAGQNAQPVAGFLTPDEQFTFAEPAGAPHETGDYYSLRPGRTPQSFVMPAQTVQTDSLGNQSMHWQYIEYGHGPTPYVAPPDVHLTAPANLSAFTQGATVSYSAAVSDPVDGTLPAAAITWREDGTLIGSGSAITHVENTTGVHVIQVTAVNGDGKAASDSITIRVNAPPSPLKAAISSPADGSAFGPATYDQQLQQYCEDVPFTATVSGGQGTLSYRWTDVRTQDSNPPGPSQQVSTQLSPTLHLCGGTGFNSSSTHDLTLTVTDGVNTATAGVRVIVFDPRLN